MLALEILRSLTHLVASNPMVALAAVTGLLASLTEVPQWER